MNIKINIAEFVKNMREKKNEYGPNLCKYLRTHLFILTLYQNSERKQKKKQIQLMTYFLNKKKIE